MYRLNVYDAVQRRLKVIFDNFEYVYVSFSGGKDSGVLLNLCIDYLRKHHPGRRLGVFHLDYEVQYKYTIDYVRRVYAANSDILDVYHCCVPVKVSTCASMLQQYWRPWDPDNRQIWVREMPEGALTQSDFGFFNQSMWDYEFQWLFSRWVRRTTKSKNVCCMVGIRTQESFNRWRAIHSNKNYRHLWNYKWTHRVGWHEYNAYPIYDWLTTDVWTANGKFGWDYNRLYDLYYRAGLPLGSQRVASPFISQAIATLYLYKAIDPDMWARMVGRVNGVGCAGIYGNTGAMGWRHISCPPGFSWKRYMYFLLDTMPKEIRCNYLNKLEVSIKFWRDKGGVLSDETIERLQQAGVDITVLPPTHIRSGKRIVKMEYIDDVDIPDFRYIPTYKRVCICIMKNDHTCKYMGFSQNKKEQEMRRLAIDKFKNIEHVR